MKKRVYTVGVEREYKKTRGREIILIYYLTLVTYGCGGDGFRPIFAFFSKIARASYEKTSPKFLLIFAKTFAF